MKKILGLTMTLAAFPMMCIGGDYEIMFKLAAVAMLGTGAWMADLFDKESLRQPQKATATRNQTITTHTRRNKP